MTDFFILDSFLEFLEDSRREYIDKNPLMIVNPKKAKIFAESLKEISRIITETHPGAKIKYELVDTFMAVDTGFISIEVENFQIKDMHWMKELLSCTSIAESLDITPLVNGNISIMFTFTDMMKP